jgi:hypothetical protein
MTQISKEVIPSLTIVPVGAFFIRNLAKLQSYKDIVHVRLGVSDFYLVTNPQLIQEVLVTKQRDFIKGEFLQRRRKSSARGCSRARGAFTTEKES